VPREKCAISFQSRLGRIPWIRPYTDETLRTLPARGVKRLLVICPAFTADCLETLDEIQIEGRRIFLEAGGEAFAQIPCLNDHPAYTQFLAAAAARMLSAAPTPA
jgi:ferrochelatase